MLLESHSDPDVDMQPATWFKQKAVSLEAENETLRRELAEQKQAIANLEARMKAFEGTCSCSEKGFTARVAASSITFDSPNLNELPITVHKPHPDATLTPKTLNKISHTMEEQYLWDARNFVAQINAATAADGCTLNAKALEDAHASKPRYTGLSAQAKEFLSCGMDPNVPPKSMKWVAFLDVMEELGFKRHDTTGRSVRFDPPSPGSNPISIHKPHPELVLTPIMLLKIVKRVRMCYGPNQPSLFGNAVANGVAANTPSAATLDDNRAPSSSTTEELSKYTWFSKLSKKATDSMHQLTRTGEDAGKHPSLMKWDTFVKLMFEMGFSHDPNTAGSSVRFTPPNPNDHPISIHKPHPDSTLTPIMLIKVSKRLARYYAWNEGDFVNQTAAATTAGQCDSAKTLTGSLSPSASKATPENNYHHLPIKWDTFVKFMISKGFKYEPSTAGRGSSVRFDPPSSEDHPISIRIPHPDTTLTPMMLKNIGQWLRKLYGWNEERFAFEANAAITTRGRASLKVQEDAFMSNEVFRQALLHWLTVGVKLNTNPISNPGCLPLKWETFVRLMTDMGFEVDQTTSFSLRFEHPNMRDHPITIHKPHPNPVLTPIMLIKIGKRLQRYYGLEKEDFAARAFAAATADLEARD